MPFEASTVEFLSRRAEMADKIRLLLACSDPVSRAHLAESLKDTEFETILAFNCAESSNLLAKVPVSMVFCEDQLPGGGFPKLLNLVKHGGTNTPIVVLSRTGEWEEYLNALRLGAFDMVIPPYDRVAIHTVAYNALHESRVSRGDRGVEAIVHMPPSSALRSAAGTARAAYGGQGPNPRASRNAFGLGHEQAAGSLPGIEKKLGKEESLSSSSSPTSRGRGVPRDDAPSGNQEADGSVAEEKEV
jgi:DNA-binding NarL/FixJ family response regulator